MRNKAQVPESPPLITTSVLAGMLGICPQTVVEYRRRGIGPRYFKIANQVRYARRDIDAWIATRRVAPKSVPEFTLECENWRAELKRK